MKINNVWGDQTGVLAKINALQPAHTLLAPTIRARFVQMDAILVRSKAWKIEERAKMMKEAGEFDWCGEHFVKQTRA